MDASEMLIINKRLHQIMTGNKDQKRRRLEQLNHDLYIKHNDNPSRRSAMLIMEIEGEILDAR